MSREGDQFAGFSAEYDVDGEIEFFAVDDAG
jgi:hypothetical protein